MIVSYTEEKRNPLRLYIRSIQARNQGARLAVSVSVEDGEHSESRCFLLTAGSYCRLNLKKGEISEEEFERLECASRFCTAVDCGENLLSYGANSVQTLTRKIMRHGYTKQEATEAAEYLESIGLINEREDLLREVEKCLRKHWGAERIRGHLWTRGYGRHLMDELPSVLEQVDFSEQCAALIRKQYGGWPQDRETRNRMVASLYRYGYKLDEIKEAGKRLEHQQ
jgi:SOS response regulatory protein OraA/RecX